MVREKHGPQLDGLHVVGVVADEPGEGDLSDGGQLLHGEAARPPGVLVPEPSNIGCVFFQFFATKPLPTNRSYWLAILRTTNSRAKYILCHIGMYVISFIVYILDVCVSSNMHS